MLNAIRSFATANLQDATLALLSSLGIRMQVRTRQEVDILTVLTQPSQTLQAIIRKVEHFYFVGAISDHNFTGQFDDDDEAFLQNEGRYPGMFVFAVDIRPDTHITRSEMATLTRAFNRASKAAPVAIAIRYREEGHLRFALTLCERTTYKRESNTGEKPGRVSILRGIDPTDPHRGHLDVLADMRLGDINTFEGLYASWLRVFDNDKLTDNFYKELQSWFFWAVKEVSFPNDICDDKDDRDYNPENVIRLITRLIFVWFLKEKGLVPEELFKEDKLASILKRFNANGDESNYYHAILQNLFFATLNKEIEKREFMGTFIENKREGKKDIKTFLRHAKELAISKEAFIEKLHGVPYMNNSLFECLDNKERNGHTYSWDGFSDINKPHKQAVVPNYLFFVKRHTVDLSEEYNDRTKSSEEVTGLLNILNKYKFTVEENTPLDVDVALDPELLGKVFENLLASYAEDEENKGKKKSQRKKSGSFYTPRPIVQYMVDETLVAYLQKKVPEIDGDTFRDLISYSDTPVEIPAMQAKAIVQAVFECKVLDPACGSGAFPMGMLQQMAHLLSRVDKDNKIWEEVVDRNSTAYEAGLESLSEEEREKRKAERNRVFSMSKAYPDYARKLYLIENCIYGVDIQSIAVQITRLRFFISLVCEQIPNNDPYDNYGIHPLPNLEMKFVCANTLVKLENIEESRELFKAGEVLANINKLKSIRHDLFVVTNAHIKRDLLEEDRATCDKIRLAIGSNYKANIETQIATTKQAIELLSKDMKRISKMPDTIEKETVSLDLFGEQTVTKTYSAKKRQQESLTRSMGTLNARVAKLQKLLVCGQDKIEQLAIQLTRWSPYDQNISSEFFDAEWMFQVKDGFDIVIGNPPYIKEKENKSAFDKLHESPYYKAKMDIWFMFTCYGFDFLKENGILSYIAQNQWYTSAGATLMREKIRTEGEVLIVNDFNSYMVFESASTQTMIFFIRKNSEKRSYHFRMRKIIATEPTKQDMIDCIDTNAHSSIQDEEYEYSRTKMQNQTFVFANGGIEQVLDKISDMKNFEFTEKEISQGIIGGPDDAFKFDDISGFELTEKNLLFNFHTATNGYYTPPTDTFLFYSTKETIPIFSATKYPNIYYHMNCYREKLENRRETLMGRNEWYHLWWGRDRKLFEPGAKLVWTSRTLGKCFTYSELEFYGSRNLFFVKSDRVNLKFLCGLLNSTLLTYFMDQKLKHNGELLQIDKVQFMMVPIFVPDITKQTPIIHLVDCIIETKQNNLNANIDKEIQAIDLLVYKLYNLTYDEVKIIDQETNITETEYNSNY